MVKVLKGIRQTYMAESPLGMSTGFKIECGTSVMEHKRVITGPQPVKWRGSLPPPNEVC